MFRSSLVLMIIAASVHADYPRLEMLVEPEAAAKAKDYVVLDVRPIAKYDAGHVPGAIWVDHESWSKTFGTNQDPKEWSERIGALGISPKSKVLIYDDAMQKDSARVWWILRYFGAKDVRLMNGGWTAWTAAKLPTSTVKPEVVVARFPIAAVDAARHADKAKVMDVVQQKSLQIVDARSEKEHCGDDKKAKQGGHIPGAMHLEWSDAIDKTTHRFKSADELKELFKKANIDVTRPTVTHCQSGGRSSVMAFTMELMGAPPVANYYRGWSEWGNAEDVPVAVPKKK